VELNPRSPDAHLARGTLRLRSGVLNEALEDFDLAIALDPRYATAYNKRCVVTTGLGLPAKAIADCEKAVALDPRNHEAWINTGRSTARSGAPPTPLRATSAPSS